MNKSVLIVICDFLLLSLLSLANFDNIQTEDDAAKEEAKEAAIEQSFTDSQMLDLLKMSLDSERDRRQALNTDVEKLSKSAEETRLQAEQQKKIIEARESELKQMALTKAQLENERAQILEKSNRIAGCHDRRAQHSPAKRDCRSKHQPRKSSPGAHRIGAQAWGYAPNGFRV